jgi:F-type H+-transporting ATPase subunit gamma
MSESTVGLRAKIATAGDLQAMARTMKTVAAANISQYDHAVAALADYDAAVQWTLAVCMHGLPAPPPVSASASHARRGPIGAVVFGTDQGLAGQFNETISAYALDPATVGSALALVWPVGERVTQALADSGAAMGAPLQLPGAVDAIASFVGQLVVEIEARHARGEVDEVYVIHHRPGVGVQHAPVSQRLLPLDAAWVTALQARRWPRPTVPQALPGGEAMLMAAVSEYLFVSLYRACCESLASENTARWAAMQRAEKNIGELQQELQRSFHAMRQGAIDAELFDLVAGFETERVP